MPARDTGSIRLPKSVYNKTRRACIAAWNIHMEEQFKLAQEIQARLIKKGYGKRGFDWISEFEKLIIRERPWTRNEIASEYGNDPKHWPDKKLKKLTYLDAEGLIEATLFRNPKADTLNLFDESPRPLKPQRDGFPIFKKSQPSPIFNICGRRMSGSAITFDDATFSVNYLAVQDDYHGLDQVRNHPVPTALFTSIAKVKRWGKNGGAIRRQVEERIHEQWGKG